MKVAVQIFVISMLFALAFSASSTWGVRNSTDLLIFSKDIFRAAIAKKAQLVYYDVPEAPHNNHKVISAILLQDKFTNSSGPSNTLYYGGPGSTYASIQMRTHTGNGLNVTILVYGQ